MSQTSCVAIRTLLRVPVPRCALHLAAACHVLRLYVCGARWRKHAGTTPPRLASLATRHQCSTEPGRKDEQRQTPPDTPACGHPPCCPAALLDACPWQLLTGITCSKGLCDGRTDGAPQGPKAPTFRSPGPPGLGSQRAPPFAGITAMLRLRPAAMPLNQGHLRFFEVQAFGSNAADGRCLAMLGAEI